MKGKRILLTGATGGIGQAIARALDNEGARLVLVARNADRLEILRKSLPGNGHDTMVADLTSESDRDALVARCASVDEPVDLLINNAGITDFVFLEQHSPDRIETILATNLLGPILLCQRLVPVLKRRPAAQIVNIGSTFGSIGYPGFSVYCASKFGLRGFTESLRRELADTGVRVTYVAPRAARTELNSASVVAMNQAFGTAMDDPDDVATQVVKAIAVDGPSERFLGWPEKFFVRLNAVVPNLVDGNLRKRLATIRHFANRQ